MSTSTGKVPGLNDEESRKAAELIQKAYRGHRTRRELGGFGLDASTRWHEAVRDARYKKTTTPLAPEEKDKESVCSPAKARWNHATQIARRAGADDHSPSISDISLSEASTSDTEQAEIARRKSIATEKRKRTAKMMDLQYFLEMVDQKHRYGSNLRKFHNYWKTQDTKQNFFYWVDQGDGKDLDLPECIHARLDKEQVRYLSREERLKYLVKVNEDGLLVWAKNGERVWTKDELYKDSLDGIVPTTDPTPEFKYNIPPPNPDNVSSSDETSSSDDESDEESDDASQKSTNIEGERYVNEEFHRARGAAKFKHVSAAVLFNHMIRSSLKKGHKWIFVADTSFRLYIGYKQSGSFQHSSFLHGARILSAGLIKVKDGQLRKLSPLSGHYRPPTANFRAFVDALREDNVDMSRVSISRSYAVLVGLEGYVKTRRKVKKVEKVVSHGVDKMVRPEKVKQEKEDAQDKSESAELERQYLEKQRLAELEHTNSHTKSSQQIPSGLTRVWTKVTDKTSTIKHQGVSDERGVPGTGPEDGIPAPEGKR